MLDVNLETVEQISNEKIKVAVKLILKEMNFKDEMINELRRENEGLKKIIEDLKKEFKSSQKQTIEYKDENKIKTKEKPEKEQTKPLINIEEISPIKNNDNNIEKEDKYNNKEFNVIFENRRNLFNNRRENTFTEPNQEKRLFLTIEKSRMKNRINPNDNYLLNSVTSFNSSTEDYLIRSQNSMDNLDISPTLTNNEKKNEIKNLLADSKLKLSKDKFKIFIATLKELTSAQKKYISNEKRNEIMKKIKNILGDNLKELYEKFEKIIIKK